MTPLVSSKTPFFTSDLVDTVVWFSYMLVFFGDSSGGEDVPYVKMLVTPMFDSFSARGAAGGGWITSCWRRESGWHTRRPRRRLTLLVWPWWSWGWYRGRGRGSPLSGRSRGTRRAWYPRTLWLLILKQGVFFVILRISCQWPQTVSSKIILINIYYYYSIILKGCM